jgi:subfamily B ATP-binding cassette protein MsbA
MKKLFLFLYPYLIPHRRMALIAVALILPLAAIKGLEAQLVRPIIDKAFLNPATPFKEVVYLAISLFGLALINYPCRFFHFYYIRYVVDKASCDLRYQVFQKLQRLPMSYYNSQKAGTLISQVLSDTQVVSQGFKSILDIIREPLQALVMFSIALYHDWQLTLIFIVVAPIFAGIFISSGKKVRKSQESVQSDLAGMTHSISEGVSGQKIIKAFHLQNYVVGRFAKAQDRYFKNLMVTTVVEENAHPLVELVGALAFSLVIVFAYFRLSSGAITPGDMMTFLTALILMMDPIRKYSQANVKVNQALAGGQRILELMNLQEEDDTGKLVLSKFEHDIEFKNVCFAYGERSIIRNFNLRVKKGEKIGLVGTSGAGKSTIISLLLRLYPVTSGEILIDSIPIQNFTLSSLRKFFGPVSQDIFLFHDTVTENLRVGENYSDAQMMNALKIAEAYDFVGELEKGLESMIGDRGTKLSGGQGQRLTIARAVLQNPQVLLFDEATSALDSSSEQKVQKALEQWSGNKTVLAVAHRLSTVQNYDRILVMREGEIVEEGPHEFLMNHQGEYYKLYQLISKEAETVKA